MTKMDPPRIPAASHPAIFDTKPYSYPNIASEYLYDPLTIEPATPKVIGMLSERNHSKPSILKLIAVVTIIAIKLIVLSW